MLGFLRLITDPPKRKTNAVPKASVRETKRMRENMSEKRIDKALENTFPASDPPAWY